MGWVKQNWKLITVTALIQTVVGLIATTAIDAIVSHVWVRDIGVVVLWLVVILGGAAVIAANYWRRTEVTSDTGNSRSSAEAKLDRASRFISIEHDLGAERWIHLRVINSGPTDRFIAQVVAMKNTKEKHTLPWSIKWRDVPTEERRIVEGGAALLDLATGTLPSIEPGPNGQVIDPHRFDPGSFRFYSVSEPRGFCDSHPDFVLLASHVQDSTVNLRVRVSSLGDAGVSPASREVAVKLGFSPYVNDEGIFEWVLRVSIHEF